MTARQAPQRRRSDPGHRADRGHHGRAGRRHRPHPWDGSCAPRWRCAQVAGTTYAADGAAQIAINDLRTGYNLGDAEPASWAYNNALGTGCFGYNADGSTVDGIAAVELLPRLRR